MTIEADLTIDALLEPAIAFDRRLEALRATLPGTARTWHPYGRVPDVIYTMMQLLGEPHRDLRQFLGEGRVVDVAPADGELAFFWESLGCRAAIADFGDEPEHLGGARRLKQALGSNVETAAVDFDRGAMLDQWYDVAFFLGALFHFKNPYGILEGLAKRARHCVLGTRVMRTTADRGLAVSEYPMAYLLDTYEANNDPTCYWIFSERGLQRLVGRAGWEILDYRSFGNLTDSDPSSADGDERAFCLLRSGLC